MVKSDEQSFRSAERNQPKTPGRLVKLKPTLSNANDAAAQDSDDTNVTA